MFQYHKANGATVQVTAHGDGTLTIKSSDRTGYSETIEMWGFHDDRARHADEGGESEWDAMYDALMHLAGG